MAYFKHNSAVLWWFGWSVASWLTCAGSVCLLTNDLENAPWRWWLVLTLPPLAVFCAWRAIRAGAGLGRWARLIFWTVALPGAALLVLLFQGQSENLKLAYSRQLLMVGIALPILALVLVAIREIRAGGFKGAGFGWIFEILGGAACLTVIAVFAYFIWLEGFIEPLRQKAEARWAEIGRPMTEFGKTIHPVAENESLRELTHDLAPFGVVAFYKTGSGGGTITTSNNVKMPDDVRDFEYNAYKGGGDSLKVPAKAAAELDASRSDFDRLYSGILQRDPPVWDLDRGARGFALIVPDYLSTRLISQWIAADAYHRLDQGDGKGASEAVAAEMRMVRNMGEQPILVSNMIHIAVESLFTPLIARLPDDPNAMRQLAAEVAENRRQFEVTAQAEVWAMMRAFEKPDTRMEDFVGFVAPQQPLPKWLQRRLFPVYCQSFWRLECYKAWLVEANVVEICARAANQPDLGEQEIVDAENRDLSFLTPNILRAWLRLNAGLLVREQAEMVRMARAQIEAGKGGKLGEYGSVVIPGSKWILSGDAAANTITMKLTPLPKWIAENEVTSNEFWLLPLDGSKPWQLRPAAGKVSLGF